MYFKIIVKLAFSFLTIYNYFMEENLPQTPVQTSSMPPVTVPTEPQVPLQAAPSKPNTSRVFLLIAVLALILVVLGGGAIFYSLKMQPTSQPTPTTTTVNQPSPSVSVSPTPGTVSNSTGNSDEQLNKDTQTVNNNLNAVDQGLNSYDQSVSVTPPTDLSQ